MRRARLACAGVLTALLAGWGPCEDEARVRKLEAERAALLRASVPKAELWAELERKGVALERARPLEKELAAREMRAQAENAGEPAFQAQEEDLRLRRGEVEAERARLERELAQAQAETAQREATLVRFDQRHRQIDPAP